MLDHLPERDRPAVKQRLRRAWARDDHARALDGCARSPASSSARTPAPPARCAKGMEETLTAHPARDPRQRSKRTLESTNPCESMIEIVRRTSRNVKRWQSGDMCLRWTAAGMLEAEQQFRKIIGYSDLAKLAIAIERDLAAQRDRPPTPTRGGRYARHRLTITPGPPSRSSTTNGTSSLSCLPALTERGWRDRGSWSGESSVRIGSKLSAHGHRRAMVDRSWIYSALAPSGSCSRESRERNRSCMTRPSRRSCRKGRRRDCVKVIGDRASRRTKDAAGRADTLIGVGWWGWPCGQ